MTKLFAAVGVVLMVTGCASPKLAKMNPKPIDDVQEVRWNKGVPNVLSKGVISTVFLAPESNGSGTYIVDEHVMLLVGIKNNSPTAFNVQETDITATGNGKPLKVWTAQEVEEDIRSKAASARTWAAIAGALNAVGTGMSAGRSYYSGRIGGTTYSGSTYNQSEANAAMDRASAQNAAMFDSINAAEQAGLSTLENLLKATTVEPGGKVLGWVRVGVPDVRPAKSRYELVVQTAGEYHRFTLDESVSMN